MLTTAFLRIIGVGDPWEPASGTVHLLIRVLSIFVLACVVLALVWAFALLIRRLPTKTGQGFTLDNTNLFVW